MSKVQQQITAIEFSMHLNEKYILGRTYSQIQFDAIAQRIERQNLTATDLKHVQEFIAKRKHQLMSQAAIADAASRNKTKAHRASIVTFIRQLGSPAMAV